ncbi:alpha/beta fold hydrolase [Bdellovibrionota bacterium FG-2]
MMKNILVFLILVSPISSVLAAHRDPIIFAHGLGMTAEPYETVVPMKSAFKELGYDIFIAHTPFAGSIEERAAVLRKEILRLVPEGKFHLLGHSMGGLDIRLVVHRYPQIASRCLSITTLATPHHGSPIADFIVDHLGSGEPVVNSLLNLIGGDLITAKELTTKYLAENFNQHVVDRSDIRYFSMGFYVPSPIVTHLLVPWLWVTHGLVANAGSPDNDGMVSVESARWGEDLGAFPGDHYSETGPIPLGTHMIYRKVYETVTENLDQNF